MTRRQAIHLRVRLFVGLPLAWVACLLIDRVIIRALDILAAEARAARQGERDQ